MNLLILMLLISTIPNVIFSRNDCEAVDDYSFAYKKIREAQLKIKCRKIQDYKTRTKCFRDIYVI